MHAKLHYLQMDGIVVAMMLVMFLLLLTVAGADFLINDDFNRETTGAKPAGYLLEELGGSVEIDRGAHRRRQESFISMTPAATASRSRRNSRRKRAWSPRRYSFMQPALGTTAKVLRLLDREGVNAAVHIETQEGRRQQCPEL